MAATGRGRGLILAHACLSLVLITAIACTTDSEGQGVAACSPIDPGTAQEQGARDLIELAIWHASVFAAQELPGQQLRQIYIPQVNKEAVTFYFAPVPGKGEPIAAVYRNNVMQWQVGMDERVRLPEEMPVLDITGLRHGPDTGVQRLEEAMPGVEAMGVGLVREADCELRWHVGGTLGTGKEQKVIKGVLTDSTGHFEITERYDFPVDR